MTKVKPTTEAKMTPKTMLKAMTTTKPMIMPKIAMMRITKSIMMTRTMRSTGDANKKRKRKRRTTRMTIIQTSILCPLSPCVIVP